MVETKGLVLKGIIKKSTTKMTKSGDVVEVVTMEFPAQSGLGDIQKCFKKALAISFVAVKDDGL